ncbi:MAG TPA: hypothetical protein VF377_08380 [Acidimicrobiia bacterium]|jgi:hypothetical protein
MGQRDLIGHWDAGFRQFSIIEDGADLLLVCPDAPPGYEGRLIPIPASPECYSMRGGPFDGSEIVEADGTLSLGGEIALRRLDRPAAAPAGWGLHVEPLTLEPGESREFEQLWNRMAHPSRPEGVGLDGHSVCRFVQWLTERDYALFCGSHDGGLDVMQPENWPKAHFGPSDRPVVYATRDGICSMFISVVDRAGADRVDHGVERFHRADGDRIDLYHFSSPRGNGYSPGVLYVLPRERFDPVPMYRGGPLSGEWTSTEPVRPLASVAVTPADFPFLDSVGLVD